MMAVAAAVMMKLVFVAVVHGGEVYAIHRKNNNNFGIVCREYLCYYCRAVAD